jgi:RNA recognition motif-containing protein
MLSKKIHVVNLPPSATEMNIADKFRSYGVVNSVKLLVDRTTGRSIGQAYVEMGNTVEAKVAVDGLHGTDYAGWRIGVASATPTRGPSNRRRD